MQAEATIFVPCIPWYKLFHVSYSTHTIRPPITAQMKAQMSRVQKDSTTVTFVLFAVRRRLNPAIPIPAALGLGSGVYVVPP